MIFLFPSLWKTLLNELSNVWITTHVILLKEVHKMPDKISLSQKKIETQRL